MPKQLLCDFFGYLNPTEINESINESTGRPVMILEGIFQRSNTENVNKRVYPKKLWETILTESSNAMTKCASRGMFGHLEHPKDGVTNLNVASHIVTGLKLQENGDVIGNMEIFDTPEGLRIQEYVKKRARIGVSSRGRGSIGQGGVVQEDYALDTFDVVGTPSTPGAYPKQVKPLKTKAVSEDINVVGNTISEQKESVLVKTKNKNQYSLIEATALSLLNQDVTALAQFQRSGYTTELLEASSELSTLAETASELSGPIELLKSKLDKRREDVVFGVLPVVLDSQILESEEAEQEEEFTVIRDAQGNIDYKQMYNKQNTIIESLVDAYNADLDEYRELVEDRDVRVSELEDGLRVIQEASQDEDANDLDKADSPDAEIIIEALTEKYAAALVIINELSGTSEHELMDEMIEDKCQSDPRFDKVRPVLEACKTLEELTERFKVMEAFAPVTTQVAEAHEGTSAPVITESTDAPIDKSLVESILASTSKFKKSGASNANVLSNTVFKSIMEHANVKTPDSGRGFMHESTELGANSENKKTKDNGMFGNVIQSCINLKKSGHIG